MTHDPPFPLVGLITPFLRRGRRGKERYLLVEQGDAAVGAALDALFASGEAPAPALDELYGLTVVLEEQQNSATAALRIRAVLDADPRVREAYGEETRRIRAMRASFAAFRGEHGQHAGSTERRVSGPTVELRQLGRGFDRDRARAQARSGVVKAGAY